MATINIQEVYNSLKAADHMVYALEFLDKPDSDYVSDAITEIADDTVSIYYSEMRNWLFENEEAFDCMAEAVAEGFIDTSKYDFYSHIRSAQYLQASQAIYDSLDDYLALVTYYKLLDKGVEQLDSDILDEILDDIEQIERFWEIDDRINLALEAEDDSDN